MTIVVVHAPSPSGAVALRTGITTALKEDEELVLVSALSGSDAAGAADAERAMLRADAEQVVGDAAVTWRADVVAPGVDRVGAVVEHVNGLDPSVVVVGTPHRSAVGKLLLGRTQQRLLLEIDHPILLVKTGSD